MLGTTTRSSTTARTRRGRGPTASIRLSSRAATTARVDSCLCTVRRKAGQFSCRPGSPRRAWTSQRATPRCSSRRRATWNSRASSTVRSRTVHARPAAIRQAFASSRGSQRSSPRRGRRLSLSRRALTDYINPEIGRVDLEVALQIELSDLDPDQPIPLERIAPPEKIRVDAFGGSRYRGFHKHAVEQRLTIRQMISVNERDARSQQLDRLCRGGRRPDAGVVRDWTLAMALRSRPSRIPRASTPCATCSCRSFDGAASHGPSTLERRCVTTSVCLALAHHRGVEIRHFVAVTTAHRHHGTPTRTGRHLA